MYYSILLAVMNGVKQGAVLSPISLAIYSDDSQKNEKTQGCTVTCMCHLYVVLRGNNLCRRYYLIVHCRSTWLCYYSEGL